MLQVQLLVMICLVKALEPDQTELVVQLWHSVVLVDILDEDAVIRVVAVRNGEPS
jgi:hypothetical protein